MSRERILVNNGKNTCACVLCENTMFYLLMKKFQNFFYHVQTSAYRGQCCLILEYSFLPKDNVILNDTEKTVYISA